MEIPSEWNSGSLWKIDVRRRLDFIDVSYRLESSVVEPLEDDCLIRESDVANDLRCVRDSDVDV